MLDSLDMRLNLDIDNYLKQFESFKFIDLLIRQYNGLKKIKEDQILDLRDSRFYNRYQKVYNLLSVLTLKRDFDDNELMFIANIAYKQKGSIESIRTILTLVKCEYTSLEIVEDIYGELSLNINVSFEDVREIYLSSKYLQLLCQDLLFYTKYNVTIDSMSVRYNLVGDVNKRYAIYSTYDLNTKVITTVDTSEIISETRVETDEVLKLHETIEEVSPTGLKKSIEINRQVIDVGYIETKTVSQEEYKEISTSTIDTYEW